jgi:hypothetical protein
LTIDPKIWSEFLTGLAGCHNRQARGALLGAWAARLNLSAAQLRRLAKDAGVAFGYARRCDAGMADAALAAAAEAACKLITASNGKMPSHAAIARAEGMGWIPAGVKLTEAYLDRYIRQHDIRRSVDSAPRITRLCTWGAVGHVMQIDSTNCAQWWIEDSGEIRACRRGEVYRNKPADGSRPRIMRYVATDPTSGLFRVRYFLTTGERAEVSLEFLYEVMSRAADPEKLPMAGVPNRIVLDGGPGNASSAFKNACESLGVELTPHMPHKPWAKGAVETTMHIWERTFESELSIWPASSIDELNARAYAENCRFCSERIHSRHGQTRSAFYAASREPIRLPPPWEIFLEAAHTAPEERTVKGGSLISFEGDEYLVAGLAGCGTGDKVMVRKAVLDWDARTKPLRIEFKGATVIECALAKNADGSYQDRRVYGERVDETIAAQEARPAQDLETVRAASPAAPVIRLDSLPDHAVAPARLEIAAFANTAPIGKRRVVALLELADRLGREILEREIAELGWGDLVTSAQIESSIQRLRNPRSAAAGGMGAQARTA